MPGITLKNAEEVFDLISSAIQLINETRDNNKFIVFDDEIYKIALRIIEEHEFPIIISIPPLGEVSRPITDTITELIKRKIGIELKSE